jgi:hypothetical protein
MKSSTRIIISATVVSSAVVLTALIILIIRYLLARRVTTTTMQQFSNTNLPRGYRNNNPLNIRISSAHWLGKVANNTDGAFEQFSDIKYGYRAAIKTIQTYINKYGCDTIQKIISRWAPASENNTTAYIANVAKRSGISANATIDPHSEEQLTKIVYAMAISENGSNPLPNQSDIQDAWDIV